MYYTVSKCFCQYLFSRPGSGVQDCCPALFRTVSSEKYSRCSSFTDTLLFGFFCDLDGDDETVHVDPTELKEGHWMTREEMPDRSGNPSLTAEMQNIFRLGKEPK